MTDHSPPAGDPPSVDLLVVAGMTVDTFADGSRAAGGAARYSVEAAVADGLRVALHTVAGPEQEVAAELERFADSVAVIRDPAASSIRFEHHGTHDARRLRLTARTDPIAPPVPGRLPTAGAVLFAPVAGEISDGALGVDTAPLRAAGLQGWLRVTDADGWVSRRQLSTLQAGTADALRRMDLLLASVDELRGSSGPEGVGALRAWAGLGPELVVTAGVAGAWLDDGHAPVVHLPAAVVTGRDTIGAGDAFAAILAGRRGSGMDLREAAAHAIGATARYLAARPGDTVGPMDADDIAAAMAALDGTTWRAIRFGPALGLEPPPEAEFSLQVFGDRLAGKSGCNRYMGGWKVEDGRLAIGPLAGTMMWCDGLMELERAYLVAIQAVTALRKDDEHLVLLAGEAPVAEFSRS